MISKSSFFDFSLIHGVLRRQLWTITLSAITLFFTLPLPVVMMIQNSRSPSKALNYDPNYLRESTTKTVTTMLSMDNIFLKFVLIALAVIAGISVFSHLHSKEKTDFYHALPISRKKLFITRFIAGIITVIPAYLINLLLAVIFAGAFGFGNTFTIQSIFQGIGVNLVFFLLVYATGVLSAILCGNTIISLLLFLWINFSPSICVVWYEALQQSFYKTYAGGNEFMEQLMVRLSPIIQYFAANSSTYKNYLFTKASVITEFHLWMWLALYLWVFILVTALAFWLNLRRKSEAAGSAIAFCELKSPLKFYMVTVIAIGTGLFLGSIVNNFWMYIGFFLGGILCHLLVEIIYHFDFKAIFKNIKWFAVYAVLFALFIAGMYFDITGFDRYQPDPNKLSSVDITMYGYLPEAIDKNRFLSKPENIAIVCELSKIGMEHRNDSVSDNEAPDVHYFTVKFDKKNGGQAWRSYHLTLNPQIRELLDKLRYSEEFTQKRQPLFYLNKEQIAVMSFQSSKNMNFDVRPAAITDGGQIEEILNTARAEWKSMTPQYLAETIPVCVMSTTKNKEEFSYKNNYYMEYSIPIYPCFTKTLKLIKTYSDFEPDVISIDDVTSIQLNTNLNDNGKNDIPKVEKDNGKMITNPLDMAVLLQNSVSSDLAAQADPNFTLEPGIQLCVKLKHSLSNVYMSFPKGKVPYAVLEQYQ